MVIKSYDSGVTSVSRFSTQVIDPDNLPPTTPGYAWMTSEAYESIFVRGNTKRYSYYFSVSPQLDGAFNKVPSPHFPTPSLNPNTIRVATKSPPPPSYIHTEVGHNLIPDQALSWGHSPTTTFLSFPISPINFTDNQDVYVKFSAHRRVSTLRYGIMTIGGYWIMNGYDTYDSDFGFGFDPAIALTGNGFFIKSIALDSLQLASVNGGHNFVVGRFFCINRPASPDSEIVDIFFTWGS